MAPVLLEFGLANSNSEICPLVHVLLFISPQTEREHDDHDNVYLQCLPGLQLKAENC